MEAEIASGETSGSPVWNENDETCGCTSGTLTQICDDTATTFGSALSAEGACINAASGGGGSGTSDWYNTSGAWSYRKNITINASQVNGTQTNFPVMVRLASDSDLAGKAQSSGNDILFTNTSGTKLDHEIELYNSSTGQLVAWVRMPTLVNTSDTTLYMYYGNSSVGSQQNATGVWDSSYKGVWHLNGTTLSALDSTANGNNGTISAPAASSGYIDGAGSFNGTNDKITLTRTSSMSQTSAWTLSAWTYATSAPSGAGVISEDYGTSDSDVQYELGYGIDEGGGGSSKLKVGFYDGTWRIAADSDNIPTTTWVYIVGTWNGTNLVLYKNGSLVTSSTPGGTVPTGLASFYIGRRHDTFASVNYFPGLIDEPRVSGTARSAQWIQTEYNNQRNGSTFLSLGGEQASTAWYSSSWSYRKNITINASQVNGTQTNFPVMVRLASDSDLAADAQDDGDDILFAQGTVKLDHEIELFNGSTGELVAWVRMPNLANTTNTTLYMYYGNSSVGSQQNRTGVWDSDYKLVMHMGDGSVVNLTDSTSYAHSSTNSGGTVATGNMGGATAYSGSAQYSYVSYNADMNFANTTTMSGWVYLTSDPSSWMYIFNHPYSTTHANPYVAYALFASTDSNKPSILVSNNGASYTQVDSTDALVKNTWYYVVGVSSPGAGNEKIYVNGAQKNTGTGPTSFNMVNTPNSGIATRNPNDNGEYLPGRVDELRISGIARSASWINTEYNNQRNDSTFTALGSEESSGGGGGGGGGIVCCTTNVASGETSSPDWDAGDEKCGCDSATISQVCDATPSDGLAGGGVCNSTYQCQTGGDVIDGGSGTTCDASNKCLLVKNSTGAVKARFDALGYVDVKGNFSQSQSSLTPPAGSFKITNSTNNVVLYADQSGNLTTRGNFTKQTSPTPSGGNDFILKDSTGQVVGLIDGATGNMYFKGQLHYNSNF
jgi:hypothetical protein